MSNRRQFLTGLLATGLVPAPSWADAGAPAYLSAARRGDGRYVLCGITAALDISFEIALPARGHAAAAHPTRPEAVAFARRPGTFAIVMDCATGQAKATLTAPKGRHFYGHGVFGAQGRWLYTTENDFEAGRGRIGVWDSAKGYARVAEFDSGGVGPHDIRRLPGRDVLVVANGGIETHPDAGRAKLNIPTMTPNLAYIEDGEVIETVALARELHKNSIRHLAIASSGQVAFAMQWQGPGEAPALVGLHRMGQAVVLSPAQAAQRRPMKNYIGSIAFTEGETGIAATSPRGGIVQFHDAKSCALTGSTPLADACGVAPSDRGILVSSGTGRLVRLGHVDEGIRRYSDLAWDNHLVAI